MCSTCQKFGSIFCRDVVFCDATYLILRKKHLLVLRSTQAAERERDGALHMHISVYFWAARAAALGLLLPPRAYCPFSCGYFERRDSCCVDFSGGHDCCVASWSSLPLVLSNIIHYSKQTPYYYMPGPVSVVVAAAAFRTHWPPEILFVRSRELLGFIKFGLWDSVGRSAPGLEPPLL